MITGLCASISLAFVSPHIRSSAEGERIIMQIVYFSRQGKSVVIIVHEGDITMTNDFKEIKLMVNTLKEFEINVTW